MFKNIEFLIRGIIKGIKNISPYFLALYLGESIRGLIWIAMGIGLYLALNNTGILIYIILMLKWHWVTTEK